MSAIARALREAAQALEAISDTPRLDAELLLAHALGINRETLLLDPPDIDVPRSFSALVARRAAGEPVAYITGRRGFWTIELEVGPGVLIPRPDSETLIAAAVEHFDGTAGPERILDLGTGSGALLLAALDQWPDASGIGIDRSQAALDQARGNAAQLGLAARADFSIGDWARGITERFDLILCNPPYVATGAELGPGVAAYEPAEALLAGEDGLADLARLAPVVGGLLTPLGFAAIEIGFDQDKSAASLFEKQGLSVAIAHDLGGRPRALLIPGFISG
ncbi:MAG TPA: peptide chain release factor N(5)-glutamine methyltransferase [Sphingomicrobium sp.]|nr:peptide chain release factor N(5)-glutamine methyltransferase [Sphingomicrobium sp.]